MVKMVLVESVQHQVEDNLCFCINALHLHHQSPRSFYPFKWIFNHIGNYELVLSKLML